MNIVIYARYSSDKQTENSIEGQLKVCHEFARRLGHTVIAEYCDRAMSGTNDRRPEFQRMIEDSKKKQFEAVLVYQLDRFARDRYDSAVNKHKLKQNGVVVMSARENITNDASGVLMEAVLEGMAEYFSKELAQKVKRGMRINAEKALYTGGGCIPLGFKIVDKHYVIDEEKAFIVQEIFQQYANGKSLVEINNYLNDRKLTTAKNKPFAKNSLYSILINKKYIGTYIYDDIEIENAIPKIISEELFYQVQEILTTNKKARARKKAQEEYLLTTKLFCGHCKDMMVGYCGTSKTGAVHHYYACKNNLKKKCSKKHAQKDWLENLVVNKCKAILTDENIEIIAKETIKAVNQSNSSIILQQIKKNIETYQKEQDNLMQAVAECPIESVRKGIYEKLEQVMQNKKELETQFAIEENRLGLCINEEQILFFLHKLKNSDTTKLAVRKALISTFVNAIYLYDEDNNKNKKITFVLNVNGTPTIIDEDTCNDIEKNFEKSSYITQVGAPEKSQVLPDFYFFYYFYITI